MPPKNNLKPSFNVTLLMCAAEAGHLHVIKKLVNTGKVRVGEKDNHGATALMYAALNGHLAVVEWLVNTDRASVDKKNNYGMNALMAAVLRGQLHVLSWLIQKGGANIGEKTKNGTTLIICGSQKGHLNVIEWLVNTGLASIHEKDYFGTNALMNAALYGHLNVVKWLIKKDRAIVDEATDRGITALMCAAESGHLEVVEWLVQHGGANIEKKDNKGTTALIYASSKGRLNVVAWLIQRGGANSSEKNNNGATPLIYAAMMGHLNVVEWLVEGAKVKIMEQDLAGKTAMYYAKYNHPKILYFLYFELKRQGISPDAFGITKQEAQKFETIFNNEKKQQISRYYVLYIILKKIFKSALGLLIRLYENNDSKFYLNLQERKRISQYSDILVELENQKEGQDILAKNTIENPLAKGIIPNEEQISAIQAILNSKRKLVDPENSVQENQLSMRVRQFLYGVKKREEQLRAQIASEPASFKKAREQYDIRFIHQQRKIERSNLNPHDEEKKSFVAKT